MGPSCAVARLRRRRRPAVARPARGGRRTAHEAAADMSSLPPTASLWRVALAIAWRSVHTYVRRPDLFVPSLVFPLVFLASFAGGLSALGSVPGFRFPPGYTVFLILFLAPVYVPLSLLKGWIHAVASVNPATAFLDAGRGLISGVHDHTALAFACAAGLVLLFGLWLLSGLRRAEAAG